MDRWGRVKQPLRAMQPRAVADAIRSRAAAAGIDRASGHSLRVGAAVWRAPQRCREPGLLDAPWVSS